jgi:hypothetical protein
MALGLNQPVTEMSTRNRPGDKTRSARKPDLLVSDSHEPPWPVTGRPLLVLLLLMMTQTATFCICKLQGGLLISLVLDIEKFNTRAIKPVVLYPKSFKCNPFTSICAADIRVVLTRSFHLRISCYITNSIRTGSNLHMGRENLGCPYCPKLLVSSYNLNENISFSDRYVM